jgi:hypothetical protein
VPQRTNDFQELVGLIQKAYSPFNAKITESAMVNIPGMSDPREIDILIENPPQSLHMKVAVEAKDEKRKMDIVRFEALLGKYFVAGGVNVDKLVVVTRSGFSKAAIQRARVLDVDLLSLDESLTFDWTIPPRRSELQTIPRLCDFHVIPPIADIPIDKICKEGAVFCSHGREHGTVRLLAASFFFDRVLPQHRDAFARIDAEARRNAAGVKIKLQLRPSDDDPYEIRLDGKKFPLQTLVFHMHFSTQNRLSGPVESFIKYQNPPHVCRIELSPELKGCANEELRNAHVIDLATRNDQGTLHAWCTKRVNEFYKKLDRRKELWDAAVRHGQSWHQIEWPVSKSTAVFFNGTNHAFSTVTTWVHAVAVNTQVTCTQFELKTSDGATTPLARFVGSIGDNKLDVLMSHDDPEEPSKVVLKIGDVFVAQTR